MNRSDLQALAETRLNEARVLLDAGFPEGAYYLAGYAVECALKACIARRTREHDFPERDAQKYYKHDLQELLTHALLKPELEMAVRLEPRLKEGWNLLKNWSEEARYERGRTVQEARDLIAAVEDSGEAFSYGCNSAGEF